jgi:hypothetical protein
MEHWKRNVEYNDYVFDNIYIIWVMLPLLQSQICQLWITSTFYLCQRK